MVSGEALPVASTRAKEGLRVTGPPREMELPWEPSGRISIRIAEIALMSAAGREISVGAGLDLGKTMRPSGWMAGAADFAGETDGGEEDQPSGWAARNWEAETCHAAKDGC